MLPLGPTHDSWPLGHAWAGLTENKKNLQKITTMLKVNIKCCQIDRFLRILTRRRVRADDRGGVPCCADDRGGVPCCADDRGGVPCCADDRGGVPCCARMNDYTVQYVCVWSKEY